MSDFVDFQSEDQQIMFAAANGMIREARRQALSRDIEPITSRCHRWFTKYGIADAVLSGLEAACRTLVAKEAAFDLSSSEQDASTLNAEWDELRRSVLYQLEDSQLDLRFSFEDSMMRSFMDHQSVVRSKLLQSAVRVRGFREVVLAKSGNEDVAHECAMDELWKLCLQAIEEDSFLNALSSSREKPRR